MDKRDNKDDSKKNRKKKVSSCGKISSENNKEKSRNNNKRSNSNNSSERNISLDNSTEKKNNKRKKRKRKYKYSFVAIENYDEEENLIANFKNKTENNLENKGKEKKINKDEEKIEKEEQKEDKKSDLNSSNPSEKYYINDYFDFSKNGGNKQKLKEKKGNLPVSKREDLKEFINSRIIFTKKEMKMIEKKITKGAPNLHAYFDLLYRASIDGDYEDTILDLTEGIYPQVILFYTEEGARFGAYVNKEKTTSFFGHEKYKEIPGTSFLMSLNSLKTFDLNKGEIATDNREERLCFGRTFLFNENGSNWFIYHPRNQFLDIKCMIGDKKSTFGVIDGKELTGTKRDYYLKDVEIFKVTLEVDDNNKNDKNYMREKKIKIKGFSKGAKRPSSTITIRNARIEEDDD